MDLAARCPIVQTQISRVDDLKERFPQAGNVIERIQQRIKPFKYGISTKELDAQYRFASDSDVSSFFDAYFRTNDGTTIGNTYIATCKNKTLNRVLTSDASPSGSLPKFERVMDRILIDIEKQHSIRRSLVHLAIGPTGSGKTAFSKGLITASIRKLWSRGIIPSRVEFSKFAPDGEPPTFDALVRYMRKCQLRDFLIWYFFSGDVECDILQEVRAIEFPETIKNNLAKLQSRSRGIKFDGVAVTLRQVSQIWAETVGYLDDGSTRAILSKLVASHPQKFLISFDGFDIVNVEDFVLDGERDTPIDLVVKFLREVLGKVVNDNSLTHQFECHFLLYLRDTTYNRLQLEFQRKPGGEFHLIPSWIVPPSYSTMVQKIAHLVGRDLDHFGLHFGTSFSLAVAKSFRDGIFSALPAQSNGWPISSAFCWNARNMKRHIGRLLMWAFNHARRDPTFETRMNVAGVGEKWLWEYLIENKQIREMPPYQVLEELFLDNTRQLRPQLRLSSSRVTALLNTGNIVGAVHSLSDFGETVGFFECIFNYLTKDTLKVDQQEATALLILVRICQFIQMNRSARLSEVRAFLCKLGYQVNDIKVSFYLYVLLRDEILSWRAAEGLKSFDDAVFLLGLRGEMLISRMMYSTSYVSEAFSISELPVDGLAREILPRDFKSNERWILNCTYNAIIAYNIVKDVERLERTGASASGIQFENYSIAEKMRETIIAEAGRIIRPDRASVRRRCAEIYKHVGPLLRRYPNLDFPVNFNL